LEDFVILALISNWIAPTHLLCNKFDQKNYGCYCLYENGIYSRRRWR